MFWSTGCPCLVFGSAPQRSGCARFFWRGPLTTVLGDRRGPHARRVAGRMTCVSRAPIHGTRRRSGSRSARRATRLSARPDGNLRTCPMSHRRRPRPPRPRSWSTCSACSRTASWSPSTGWPPTRSSPPTCPGGRCSARWPARRSPTTAASPSASATLGADPEAATAPFRAALADYHDQTEPNDWLEALTKVYVGDSIADDFVREVARFLGPADRELVLDVLHDTRYADFAAAEIKAALAADPAVANRLSMWARRLVGEAITPGPAGRRRAAGVRAAVRRRRRRPRRGVAGMLRRLTTAHTARMAEVGLNN